MWNRWSEGSVINTTILRRKKILFLTAFVPNEAAAAEKNTKIMLDDLGRFYLVDLVYFKYDIDESYIPTHKNVRVLRVCKNSVLVKF